MKIIFSIPILQLYFDKISFPKILTGHIDIDTLLSFLNVMIRKHMTSFTELRRVNIKLRNSYLKSTDHKLLQVIS